MHRSSLTVWTAAREQLPEFPEPFSGMSEPAWANLVFDAHCHVSYIPPDGILVLIVKYSSASRMVSAISNGDGKCVSAPSAVNSSKLFGVHLLLFSRLKHAATLSARVFEHGQLSEVEIMTNTNARNLVVTRITTRE